MHLVPVARPNTAEVPDADEDRMSLPAWIYRYRDFLSAELKTVFRPS